MYKVALTAENLVFGCCGDSVVVVVLLHCCSSSKSLGAWCYKLSAHCQAP